MNDEKFEDLIITDIKRKGKNYIVNLFDPATGDDFDILITHHEIEMGIGEIINKLHIEFAKREEQQK